MKRISHFSIPSAATLLALISLLIVVPASAELQINNVTDVVLQDGLLEGIGIDATTCFTRPAPPPALPPARELVCLVDLTGTGLMLQATAVAPVVALGGSTGIDVTLDSLSFSSENVMLTDGAANCLSPDPDSIGTVTTGSPVNLSPACTLSNIISDTTVTFTANGDLLPSGDPTSAQDAVTVRVNALTASISYPQGQVVPRGTDCALQVDVEPTDLAVSGITLTLAPTPGDPTPNCDAGPLPADVGTPAVFDCDVGIPIGATAAVTGTITATDPAAADSAAAAYSCSPPALTINSVNGGSTVIVPLGGTSPSFDVVVVSNFDTVLNVDLSGPETTCDGPFSVGTTPVTFTCDTVLAGTVCDSHDLTAADAAGTAIPGAGQYQACPNTMTLTVDASAAPPACLQVPAGTGATFSYTVGASLGTATNISVDDSQDICDVASASLGAASCTIPNVTAQLTGTLTADAGDANPSPAAAYCVEPDPGAGDLACIQGIMIDDGAGPRQLLWSDLPGYCKTPANNICLAAGFINGAITLEAATPNAAISPDWFGRPRSNVFVKEPSGRYVSLVVDDLSAAQNASGQVIRNSPLPGNWVGTISISDCPGSFSKKRGGFSDPALSSIFEPDPPDPSGTCSVQGDVAAPIPWKKGAASQGSDCGLKVGTGRYFVNIVGATSDDGETGWVNTWVDGSYAYDQL